MSWFPNTIFALSPKSAINLINGIQQSKEVAFERVLFALGIRYVGETVAKKLAKYFKTIDALAEASQETLVNVEEIGEKIAESVVHFFEVEENRNTIERLKSFGVQLAISEEELEGLTDKLQGNTFVISGVFQKVSRKELKKLIEDNGGKVTGSISAKTNYLVAGENMGPSKLAKAEKVGTQIISEDDFLKMVD